MDPSTSPAANNYGQMEKTSARRKIKARERDWSQAAIWGSVSIVLAVILFMAFTGDEVDTVNKVAKKPGKTETVNIPAVEDRGVNEKSEGSEEKEGSETLVKRSRNGQCITES